MAHIDNLRDYEYWIGKSPLEIREAVKANGGWHKVFPYSDAFPIWASRVRNYFNIRPQRLRRLSDKSAQREFTRVFGKISSLQWGGYAYFDEVGRYWFQTRPTGAVYHYEGENNDSVSWKFRETLLTPEHTSPVHKLLSPDGTGGSLESVIHNWQQYSEKWWRPSKGRKTVGPVGQWASVRTKVVINEVLKGSYNYSDTDVTNLFAHKHRDVKPHSEAVGFYADPTPSRAQIEDRRFPRIDRQGRTIAGSENYYTL